MTGQSLYDSFLFCRSEMGARFSLADLEELCWEAGTDPDGLPHETPLKLATELLRWADHRDQRTKLLDLLNKKRPNVAWPADYSCDPKRQAGVAYTVPSQPSVTTTSSSATAELDSVTRDLAGTQTYPSRLPTQARIDLCAFLARLPEFQTSTGRTAFIGVTLPHLKEVIITDGIPRVFASALLTVAEQSGFVPSDEEYHCLGAILSYILSDVFPDVNETDKRFCASLVVQHKLVRSEYVLSELQSRYRLDSEADTELLRPAISSQDSRFALVPSHDLVEGVMTVLKHGPKEQPYQLKIDTVGGAIRRLIIEVDEI